MSITSTSGGTFPNSNKKSSTGPMKEGCGAEVSSTNKFASSELFRSQVVPVQIDAHGSYQAAARSEVNLDVKRNELEVPPQGVSTTGTPGCNSNSLCTF